MGPEEASDQFTALVGYAATVATIGIGKGSVVGRGGAATPNAAQAAASASSAAAKGALSRAKEQAATAKPGDDAAESADTDLKLPETEEAENPDSVSSREGQPDPGTRRVRNDPAGDAVNSVLLAAGTTGDYGDELTAGRTST